jgi:hypothetical protein
MHGMRVRTGLMWLTSYTVWGFYEYNNEHKRGDFRGWATLTGCMSVSSVDDSDQIKHIGSRATAVTGAGSRTALVKNHNKCYT